MADFGYIMCGLLATGSAIVCCIINLSPVPDVDTYADFGEASNNFILLQLLTHGLSVIQRTHIISRHRRDVAMPLTHWPYYFWREILLVALYLVVVWLVNSSVLSDSGAVYAGCAWLLGIVVYELYVSYMTFDKLQNLLNVGIITHAWFWRTLIGGARSAQVKPVIRRVLRLYTSLLILEIVAVVIYALPYQLNLDDGRKVMMTSAALFLCSLWHRSGMLYMTVVMELVQDDPHNRSEPTASLKIADRTSSQLLKPAVA
ncbi:hypothetical protein RI367_005416 [Sorochytrium milnesiophthora]